MSISPSNPSPGLLELLELEEQALAKRVTIATASHRASLIVDSRSHAPCRSSRLENLRTSSATHGTCGAVSIARARPAGAACEKSLGANCSPNAVNEAGS